MEAQLRAATRAMFDANRDDLTVNSVRKLAEEEGALEPGFLKSDKWKARSKTVINDTVVCSMSGFHFFLVLCLSQLTLSRGV